VEEGGINKKKQIKKGRGNKKKMRKVSFKPRLSLMRCTSLPLVGCPRSGCRGITMPSSDRNLFQRRVPLGTRLQPLCARTFVKWPVSMTFFRGLGSGGSRRTTSRGRHCQFEQLEWEDGATGRVGPVFRHLPPRRWATCIWVLLPCTCPGGWRPAGGNRGMGRLQPSTKEDGTKALGRGPGPGAWRRG